TYFIGDRTYLDASSSLLNEGEGYFDVGALSTSGGDITRQVDLDSPDAYTGAGVPASRLQVVTVGTNNAENGGCPNHHLRISSGALQLEDTLFTGYRLIKNDFTLPAGFITGVTTPVSLTVVHDLLGCLPSSYPDNQGLAWQKLHYPRRFALGTGVWDMDVPSDGTSDSAHIAFTVPGGFPAVYAFGNAGTFRLNVVTDNSQWHVIAPSNGADDLRVVVVPSFLIGAVTNIRPVNGSGFFTDYTQNLPDSALLIVTHPKLMNEALQYAQYRESNPFNRYSTVVADVQELYLQFGGGIPRHPLAIRRYADLVLHSAPSRPHGLFLIGKSVRAPLVGGNSVANSGYRRDVAAAAACLVPSYGYPPSDMQFTLGLAGDTRDMIIPVGRLAARTPDDVHNYRDKVATLEAQPPAAWMKNILHFRGGFNASEWAEFDAALEAYRLYAEDTCFAGHVIKFVKNGAGVIQQASADSVYDFINEGVTLMTFFAHAFGGGFDISINDPHNYQWNGKYPTVIGNSCYTGNIHLADAASASEQFVLPPASGAIAFISSVDVGISSYLQGYTQDFYRSFSQVNYGKPIGEHMRYATYQQLGTTELEALNSAQTFALHGDPTIVMNSPRQVDYAISDADVSVLPDPVTADVDSFRVRAVVHNTGRATYAPFSVAVERTLLEEGQVLPAVIHTTSLPHYQDTVVITLPTLANTGGQGLSDLDVRVDLDPDVVPERDDLGNNQARLELQVTSGDLLPVYPYNFAITPDAAPLLQASTGDPFAASKRYIFQIDTTDLFNSPVMEQGAVVAPGGVLHWQPQSIYALNNTVDSLVFFWRCTVDSTGNGEYNWHEFSYQHIPNKRGWGQAHYFQFKDDSYNLIGYDRPNREFDYFSGPRSIGCEVWGNNVNLVKWSKDLEPQEGQGCGGTPALHVAVVDPFDFMPWLSRFNSVGLDFGNQNTNGACRQRQERYFIFRESTDSQMIGLDGMINQIPDGHFVLIYTYRYMNRYSIINGGHPQVLTALSALGATQMASPTAPDSVPYIFFCKKGDPSSYVEIWGDTINSRIDTNVVVTVNAHSGTIITPRTGPALAWDALYWKIRPLVQYDSAHVRVTGISDTGTEQQLYDLDNDPDSLTGLGTLISAQQYPQLRLTGAFWNDSVVTSHPAYLKRWQLICSPAPECAIDPPLGYYEHLDSVFQGQPAAVMVAVHNISEFDMDSLLMAAWVVDAHNQKQLVHYTRKRKLLVGDVLMDTIVFNTQAFPGANTIVIEANPVDTATLAYDQPEQYHFNNVATRRFFVQEDQENPVLDVTFDGVHILDGDIVSATPEIQVTLDDENRTLLLDEQSDTAYFKFFLTDPSGHLKRIYFRQGAQEVLHFVPANGPANVSKVFYRPDLGMDGVYRLQVQATDISRNSSGDNDLVVKFEV
ncbi:MAG TPA: C25 family cysteine peptidase, partial [Flavobacteriales bacterium]|nr:C25 family cysteine peptidase [Flavobacteriales bacterium]